MNIFAILAPVLGFIMEWIYKFIPNYGWTIILFTLIMKVLMFPLQVKQVGHDAGISVKEGRTLYDGGDAAFARLGPIACLNAERFDMVFHGLYLNNSFL